MTITAKWILNTIVSLSALFFAFALIVDDRRHDFLGCRGTRTREVTRYEYAFLFVAFAAVIHIWETAKGAVAMQFAGLRWFFD